jgi:hypothetical protein
MTAEIAVLNRVGVALAADSAVTVSREAGKIYMSADKLFQLSLNAPVGVMIYGNAGLLSVPWETIIKSYRTQLADKTFAKLESYGSDFLGFLTRSRSMFPAKLQRSDVQLAVEGYFHQIILKRFQKAVNDLHDKQQPLAEPGLKRLFTELVKGELRESQKWNLLDGMSAVRVRTIRKIYARDIARIRARVFEKLPVSRLTNRRLVDMAVEVLTRRCHAQRDTSSGVVIAGFGDKEHFPRLVSMLICGIAADRPLYFKQDTVSIETDKPAVVVPLAQQEMVVTFMEGIDPKLRKEIEASTGELFRALSSIILTAIDAKHPREGAQLRKNVSAGIDALLPKLYSKWVELRWSVYTSPVMQMVASLPKDELAAMAEALVNLTRFKRRISAQQETVGGPIDVAVITKGDGFVWTKRKHYFAAELNPRYIARAMRK